MEPDALIDAFEGDAGALAAAAERGLDAPVPSCPGWDVADVVAHVGSIHRWARLAVRATDMVAPPPRRPPDVARGRPRGRRVDVGRPGDAPLVDAAAGARDRGPPRRRRARPWSGPRGRTGA